MMIKKQRKIKTTVRLHEVYVIRKPRRKGQLLCAQCNEAVALISLEEAVQLAGVSSRAIHRWVEAQIIHFAETSNGLVLICLASLMAQVGQLPPFIEKPS